KSPKKSVILPPMKVMMPCPNAKSRIAFSKACMKTRTFAAKPKVTNNVEDDHDILEDYKLFELTHEKF
ncbi:18340_t:CDS:2, partial [Gigaspora rosea]